MLINDIFILITLYPIQFLTIAYLNYCSILSLSYIILLLKSGGVLSL